MKTAGFFISAFLVALFLNQHVVKTRQITVPVIYQTMTDANGNEVCYAPDHIACRQLGK